jgi:uncharacterized phage protein gp47/JayE
MPDLVDFLPLVTETVASIRNRVDADINAGLSVTDADYVDTVEGGMYHTLTQPLILEIGRLYDVVATEAIAATFPAFSWGDYLDYLGESVGVPRKDAVAATGQVTFDAGVAVSAAILIGTGTLVATTPQSADDEPVVFHVVSGGSIGIGQQVVTLDIVAEEASMFGNVTAGQIDDLQSPVSGIASVYNALPTSGGSDVESDEVYRDRVLLAWQGAAGAGTQTDYRRWALAYPGIGYAAVTPLAFGPGTVSLVVTDLNNRPFSSSAEVDAVQGQIDPPQFSTLSTGSQTLPVATLNVASTSGMDNAGKVVVRLASGPQVVSYTGKTGTTLTGCTGGTGTVPAGTTVYQGGQGNGLAPIGAIVAVSTPVLKGVVIAASVTCDMGYSLDGTGGTIAIRDDVESALEEYVNRLPPGGDVIFNHVMARFFNVTGIADVTGLTLNATPANVVVATGEVAFISSLAGIA